MSRAPKPSPEDHTSTKRQATERRKADRLLVPVASSQILALRTRDVADAMRTAGISDPVPPELAAAWRDGRAPMPDWLATLYAERAVREAEETYRHQQREEARLVADLAVEQSARDKVARRAKRFTDAESEVLVAWAFDLARGLVRAKGDLSWLDADARHVLAVHGVDPEQHSTWALHATGCDAEGSDHCEQRILALREEPPPRRAAETPPTHRFAPGQWVSCWNGNRVGMVVKVNRSTIRVRTVSSRMHGAGQVEDKTLDPGQVDTCPSELMTRTVEVGDIVRVRDRANVREVEAFKVNGPLFEGIYSLKTGEWRSAWFDVSDLLV